MTFCLVSSFLTTHIPIVYTSLCSPHVFQTVSYLAGFVRETSLPSLFRTPILGVFCGCISGYLYSRLTVFISGFVPSWVNALFVVGMMGYISFNIFKNKSDAEVMGEQYRKKIMDEWNNRKSSKVF